MNVEHLCGRKFIHGKQDCFALVREFYNNNFGLNIPNYARPDNWWDKGMNLYMESFYDNGFRVVNEHPSQWRVGDAVLMAIRAPVANHAGVFVGPGRLLHHLLGRLSCVEAYRGLVRNTTIAVVRHKDVVYSEAPQNLDLMELLPNAVRQKLAAAISQSGP